jgi:hypothetical protein
MSNDESTIIVHKVKALDTGIGREAGYANDEELLKAAQAEREAMHPAIRALLDEADARVIRAVLFGEGN